MVVVKLPLAKEQPGSLALCRRSVWVVSVDVFKLSFLKSK